MPPLRLGHRGARASSDFAENTLESFQLCLDHGCDGFEFDVRRSSDGIAVICHDPEVRGLTIARTSASELHLPTLDQVLAKFSSRAFLDIELKVSGLESNTVRALHSSPPAQGFVVSSFDPEILRAVRRLNPSIPLGFLYDEARRSPNFDLVPEWIIPHVSLVTPDVISDFKARGIKVMSWTVNRPEEMERLRDWGIDALISDDTILLAQIIR